MHTQRKQALLSDEGHLSKSSHFSACVLIWQHPRTAKHRCWTNTHSYFVGVSKLVLPIHQTFGLIRVNLWVNLSTDPTELQLKWIIYFQLHPVSVRNESDSLSSFSVNCFSHPQDKSTYSNISYDYNILLFGLGSLVCLGSCHCPFKEAFHMTLH